jgi:hypothetical protein
MVSESAVLQTIPNLLIKIEIRIVAWMVCLVSLLQAGKRVKRKDVHPLVGQKVLNRRPAALVRKRRRCMNTTF